MELKTYPLLKFLSRKVSAKQLTDPEEIKALMMKAKEKKVDG